MNKKIKKLKWLGSVGLLLAFLLAAPGIFAGGQKEKGAAGKITLTYWPIVPTIAHWKTVGPAWSKTHPNIRIEYSTAASRAEFEKKRQVAMAAGEGPDLLEVWRGSDIEHYAKMLEPLKPWADKSLGAGWEKQFASFAIASVTVKDGKIVALPMNMVAEEFVLYNKSLLDEIGVKGYNPAPKNYAEWKKLCDEITTKSNGSVIPVAYGGKEAWHIADTFVYTANQFAQGRIYKAQEGKVKWTDPVFVKTMKVMKKLFDNIYQKGAVGINEYPDTRDQYFYSRKAAMFVTGSWHIGGWGLPGGEKDGTKIEEDAIGAFLSPQTGTNPPKPIFEVGDMVAINKDSKHKKAAWEFVEWLTYGKGAVVFANLMQGSPVKKNIKITSLHLLRTQTERDAVKWLLPVLQTSEGDMRLAYKSIQDALGAAIQNVVFGKSIEGELKKVQEVSDKTKR